MTPDGWVLWYYRTRDSFGAPGLNFVDSEGRVFGPWCDHCRSKKKHENSVGTMICANHKCGKAWPYVDRFILKGEVQRSIRPGDFGSANARYFDIARVLHHFIFDKRWQWDARLYVANVLGHSARDLSVRFPAAFEDAPGPFSQSSISRRINVARTEWDRRLCKADINVSPY